MNKKIEYKVWKANRFNDELLSELVAIFYDFKKAKDFVDYQANICESYVIIENGERIYY